MRYMAALILALVLNAGANLMMKFGMKRLGSAGGHIENSFGGWVHALVDNWVLLVGLGCFAVNVLFYTYALKKIPISLAYPIMVGAGEDQHAIGTNASRGDRWWITLGGATGRE